MIKHRPNFSLYYPIRRYEGGTLSKNSRLSHEIRSWLHSHRAFRRQARLGWSFGLWDLWGKPQHRAWCLRKWIFWRLVCGSYATSRLRSLWWLKVLRLKTWPWPWRPCYGRCVVRNCRLAKWCRDAKHRCEWTSAGSSRHTGWFRVLICKRLHY